MNQDKGERDGIGPAYVTAARQRLAACHEKIVHCLGQLDDAQVWWRPREAMNSIANLVLHACGNLQQWLVTGLGGGPDVRERTKEFTERGPIPRAELLRRLAATVAQADATLADVSAARLLQAIRIQSTEKTGLTAILDSLTHLAGHTQEIVYVTRLLVGDAYRFLALPPPAPAAAPGPGHGVPAPADAVFEEMPIHPLPPGPTPPPMPPASAPAVEPARRPPQRLSPLRDYLLELEQEFQQDEDRGKLK
jgi:hypothetical protein